MRLKKLKRLHSGKVRDIYLLPNENWLIVATDRLSAYDHVLPTEIPGRGVVLTQMTNWWMEQFKDLVPNHLVNTTNAHAYGSDEEERTFLRGRTVEIKRLVPLRVEAIVRGHLCGSAWAQYEMINRNVNGIYLPEGLRKSEKLPEPIYTPSTKEARDVNITYEETISRGLLTGGLAPKIRDLSLELYRRGARRAIERGLICADTKFEFGVDPKDPTEVFLMDEVLTPDSSRFWLATDYKPGIDPPSYDKQIVRDWLDSVGWDRKTPPPELPDEIVEQVTERYWDAFEKIVSNI